MDKAIDVASPARTDAAKARSIAARSGRIGSLAPTSPDGSKNCTPPNSTVYRWLLSAPPTTVGDGQCVEVGERVRGRLHRRHVLEQAGDRSVAHRTDQPVLTTDFQREVLAILRGSSLSRMPCPRGLCPGACAVARVDPGHPDRFQDRLEPRGIAPLASCETWIAARRCANPKGRR